MWSYDNNFQHKTHLKNNCIEFIKIAVKSFIRTVILTTLNTSQHWKIMSINYSQLLQGVPRDTWSCSNIP